MSKNTHNTGGPAFPGVEHALDPRTTGFMGYPGMTLRDFFAAKAMQGMIGGPRDLSSKDGSAITEAHIAAQAYAFADAMLKERENQGDHP